MSRIATVLGNVAHMQSGYQTTVCAEAGSPPTLAPYGGYRTVKEWVPDSNNIAAGAPPTPDGRRTPHLKGLASSYLLNHDAIC